jgi:LEA14-like dessication related protein
MKKSLILIFSITLLLSACNRNTNDNPTPNTPPTIEDLKVADGFNWKTTDDYQLTLTGKVSNVVDVVSEADFSYQKAFLIADVPYTMKLTVPSYEKTVVLKYMDQEVPIELSSETLSHEFE